MKRLLWSLLAVALMLLVALPVLMQDQPALRLEITGVNASSLPVVTVAANVYDALGQPITDLTMQNFTLTGEVAALGGQIVSVQNVTNDDLTFATVMLIDVSSSMDGFPIGQARAAARAFVENIGENDPVAIMTFATTVQVVQPFTTDKSVLLNVIDNLRAFGQTALYQGAFDAVNYAAEASDNPRRVVVLLSDGAEFGGHSRVARSTALQAARELGIPVFTIGLGFGTDRSYLEQLALGTNATFAESPTPDRLVEIFTALAQQFRSEYIITLNVPVPGDGTEYTLGLRVITEAGSAETTALFRAPIPVPLIDLPDIPDLITEAITITPAIRADDPLVSVAYQLDEGDLVLLDLDDLSFTIDPLDFEPGTLTLTVIASDEEGDIGSATSVLNIAALPPIIETTPDLATIGVLTEPLEYTIDVGGQTPVQQPVTLIINDVEELIEVPHTGTLDPYQLNVGENTLTISASNEGGAVASETYLIEVAAQPPIVTISGIQDGQSIDQVTTFSVSASAQDQAITFVASVNNTPLPAAQDGVTFAIDPSNFTPGAQTLFVTASTERGLSVTIPRNILIAALPPVITIEGLREGEVISEDRVVSAVITSQTAITSIEIAVDGETVSTQDSFTLRVLDYAPGAHTLTVTAQNASGQGASRTVNFGIGAAPAATATASAVFVQQTQTAEIVATQAAIQATADQATAFFQSTQAAIEATQIAAQATEAQIVAEATASQMAVNATSTQIIVQATQVFVAGQTATATAQQATQAAAEVTQVFVAGQTATATAQQATQVAEVTQAFVAGQTATATAEQATQAAVEVTQAFVAGETATATAQQATEIAATQSALEVTEIAQTQAVLEVTQAFIIEQTATATAQQATEVAATRSIIEQTATQARLDLTATQALRETQQVFIQATQAVQTRDALATRNAQARLEATATANVRATQTAEIQATQTTIQETQAAQQTQTALERTAVALTAVAQQTISALEQTATQIVIEATQTALAEQNIAQQTATAQIAQATLTAEQAAIEQTRDAIATAAALTQTAEAEQVTQAAAAALAVQATANRQAELTLTAQRAAALEAESQAATQSVLDATITAQVATATQNALDAEATRARILAADAEATLLAQATADAQSTQAAATADAQAAQSTATESARQTAVGPTPTLTVDAVAQVPTEEPMTPTITPTLIPAEVPGEQPPIGDQLLIPIIAVIAIIVALVLLVLARRRR